MSRIFKWVMLGIVLLFVMPAGCGLIIVGTLGGDDQAAAQGSPSQLAVADIPADILLLCQQSAQQYSKDIPWNVICGVTKVETNHGRSTLPGVKSGVNSYGCCAGIAQFSLVGYGNTYPGIIPAGQKNPSTWGAFGVDGDGDGFKNVYDPRDALPAAAKYLQYSSERANGGDACSAEIPLKLRRALWGYNHACWYVEDVMEFAKKYADAATAQVAPAPVGGQFGDPGEGPQDPSNGNLVPRASNLRDLVFATWGCDALKREPCVREIQGFGIRPTGPQDHTVGMALDIVISDGIGSDPSAQQLAMGWQIACTLQAIPDKIGVRYAIWQGKIWGEYNPNEGDGGGCTGVKSGWRPYCNKYGTCGRGLGVVQGHYDHVHVTVQPGPP